MATSLASQAIQAPQATKHCGLCRETSHSSRTCRTATEPSRTREKEVLDNLFGREKDNRQREKEKEQKGYMPQSRMPRILLAPKGPRFLTDGSYNNTYRFSTRFTMALNGIVTHKAVAVA